MGIRGGFVLAFWRRFFWIAAEVVVVLTLSGYVFPWGTTPERLCTRAPVCVRRPAPRWPAAATLATRCGYTGDPVGSSPAGTAASDAWRQRHTAGNGRWGRVTAVSRHGRRFCTGSQQPPRWALRRCGSACSDLHVPARACVYAPSGGERGRGDADGGTAPQRLCGVATSGCGATDTTRRARA